MSLISDSLCTQPLIQLYPVTLSSWWYMEDNLTPWQVACEPQTTFYLLSIMVVFWGGLNRHHYNHQLLHQCHESIKWDIWIKAAAADVYPPVFIKARVCIGWCISAWLLTFCSSLAPEYLADRAAISLPKETAHCCTLDTQKSISDR